MKARIGILLISLLLAACAGGRPGTIVFTANGEDFVRRGFVDKDGWAIRLDRVLINLTDPTAFSPGQEEKGITLTGDFWVDLAAGDAEAPPLKVGQVGGVKPANYQALRFALTRKKTEPYQGYSLVMQGEASRDEVSVPFTIMLDEEIEFLGLEGYVGDEIKGLLKPGGETEVEMTFHFDHIFGDATAGEDEHINGGAVGFAGFYQAAGNGGDVTSFEIAQPALRGTPVYDRLLSALATLGHLGEGHCEVVAMSSREGEK